MAKASSPVRLQEELMRSATLAGERFHRSAAEQVEYWAAIGRSVSHIVDPDVLMSVMSGLTRLKAEPVISPEIDPEDVFSNLEGARTRGTLASAVTKANVRYQASITHPGQLEQLDPEGAITLGQFKNGVFVPVPENTR